MKKVLLSSLVFCSLFAGAQVTLVQWDVANIGFQILQAHDTMPSVTPGPAGPSQTWNFTNLNNHFTDTLVFTNPNWLPNSSSFPTSNLAVMFGSSGQYAFTRNSASDFMIQGQYADFGFGPMTIDLNPDEKLMQWPCTYNTTFTNTSVTDITIEVPMPPLDSGRLKSVKVKTSLADGWGTVTTPLVSALPCLRVREMNITTDSIWVHLSFPPMWQLYQTNVDTNYNYSYWTPNTNNQYGFPVVEINTDSAGNVTDATWLQAAPTQSGMGENTLAELSNYPNPAQNSITFLTANSGVDEIRIMDIHGNLLKVIAVKAERITADLTDLAAGTYLYLGFDAKGTWKNGGKFNIVK